MEQQDIAARSARRTYGASVLGRPLNNSSSKKGARVASNKRKHALNRRSHVRTVHVPVEPVTRRRSGSDKEIAARQVGDGERDRVPASPDTHAPRTHTPGADRTHTSVAECCACREQARADRRQHSETHVPASTPSRYRVYTHTQDSVHVEALSRCAQRSHDSHAARSAHSHAPTHPAT